MHEITSSETKIPATEWVSVMKPLLDEGMLFKIRPVGTSMLPFLAGGRDDVYLASVSGRKLKRGDIVLYSGSDGVHVLHRIHHIARGQYYMLGDSQLIIEGPLKYEDIHAVAVSYIRKGRKINCNSLWIRFLADIWMVLRPFRPRLFKLVRIFTRPMAKRNG